MGRTKAITDEELIAYIDRYVNEKCEGKLDTIKISEIGNFIRTNGMTNVNDTVIRRNKKARVYFEQLKKSQSNEDVFVVSTYKTLDVEAFLEQNHSASALKKALTELNTYYKHVSESATKIAEKYRKMEEKYNALKNETEKASNRVLQNTEKVEALKKENKDLKKEVKALRKIIDTYVYPEISNELLKQSGLLQGTEEIVDPNSVAEHMISADTKIKSKSNIIEAMFDKFEEG